ncbi:hypothetical protein DTO013F2_10373 [Penicillium roqueforti]|nr:hypothetical protein DTO013F2_10373 [Penicillium roqueforti]
MESRPDLESQKPTPQVDSPQESESEDDLALKPQPSNAHGIPTWRKCLILFVVSWMTLAVTFSSTSLLPATPEIATEFSTTSEILNVTNAGVLVAMGFSSFIWGPITKLFGRRNAYNAAILVLCACSAGTAAAINLHMFIAMRILGGFTGTFFMVAGQTILADIFEPDRLNSGLVTLFGVLPGATLIYGWTLQEEVGGMVVPIIAAFFAGVGLLGTFNGLNTYAAEVMPHVRSEVISSKYVVQYIFAAAASAAVEPVIGAIGVGWTFTICVFFALISGFLVLAITKWGIDMQRWSERKYGLDVKT